MKESEYKSLALSPPTDNRPSVFELKVITILYDSDGNHNHSYPFQIDSCNCYFFLTYDDAISKMQSLSHTPNVYCFQLRQLPIGVEIGNSFVEEYSQMWLFSGNGELLDHTLASSLECDKDTPLYPFRGRPEQLMRFQQGEIVEFMYSDTEVRLGIVLYTPATDDDVWNYLRKFHAEDEITEYSRGRDFSDDIYIVIDENYKCWGYDKNVLPTYMLSPSFPIPEELRRRLIEKYEWARQGN